MKLTFKRWWCLYRSQPLWQQLTGLAAYLAIAGSIGYVGYDVGKSLGW